MSTLPEQLDALAAMRQRLIHWQDGLRAELTKLLTSAQQAHWQGIEAEYAHARCELEFAINVLEAEIVGAVLSAGCTIAGQHLQAQWSPGRISWDNRGMAAYASVHPEVSVYRKVGQAYVSIKKVR